MNEPQDVARMLSAYREVAGPDADATARAWSGLARRARAGEVVVLEAEPTPVVARVRPIAVFAVAAAAVVAVAAVAYQLGAGSVDESQGARLEQAVQGASPSADEHMAHERAERPSSRSPAVLPDVEPTSVEPTTVEPTTESPIAPTPRPRVRRESGEPRAEPTPEPSIDAAEITTLRAAQGLVARDPAAALVQLDRHADTYPRSSMAPQRTASRIDALCQLGRADDARRVADDFIAAHPSSPLVARVRSVCTTRTISQTDPPTGRMSEADGGR